MFLVLAYDIPDDKRRTKLFKTLKRFGWPVQESVFEFHLKQGELINLKKAVSLVIEEKEDQVRYYYLCHTCFHKTEMTCSSKKSHNPFVIIA